MTDLVVRELTPDSTSRWDRFVDDCPAATFFHRAAWKSVIERTFGHRARFLFAEAAGVVQGVLPLVHVRSRLFGSSLISTSFAAYGGPVASSPAAAHLLDRHARQLADELNVAYLEYRSQAPAHPDMRCKNDIYATFRKPITADIDANLQSIPRKQRAVVRKSLAAGLTASLDVDPRQVYNVYAESVRNLGTPVFSALYFDILKDTFGEACEMLVVRDGSKIISGVVTFYFRDTVAPYYAGGTPEARRVGAYDFMYWDIMRRAGSAGRKLFDFGRSKRGTGAFDFKKNWGFEPHPLCYEYYLRRGTDLPNLSPLNPKYQRFIRLWRRLPLLAANRLGPLLARNLG